MSIKGGWRARPTGAHRSGVAEYGGVAGLLSLERRLQGMPPKR